MAIEINRDLFAAWAGLIIGGYDMYDHTDREILELSHLTQQYLYDPVTEACFASARTGQIELNPWFPRASNLSVYALFRHRSIEAYYDFLESCGDTEHKSPAFRRWIMDTDKQIDMLLCHAGFPELYARYSELVMERFPYIEQEIQRVKELLIQNGFDQCVNISFAVNLLQSPFLADYAVIDNTLYIIAPRFDQRTAIHESIHLVAKKKRKEFMDLLRSNSIEALVNVEEMRAMGFLPDMSIESQLHALEEQYVREHTARILRCAELSRKEP